MYIIYKISYISKGLKQVRTIYIGSDLERRGYWAKLSKEARYITTRMNSNPKLLFIVVQNEAHRTATSNGSFGLVSTRNWARSAATASSIQGLESGIKNYLKPLRKTPANPNYRNWSEHEVENGTNSIPWIRRFVWGSNGDEIERGRWRWIRIEKIYNIGSRIKGNDELIHREKGEQCDWKTKRWLLYI